jgi:hypothetical protein
MKKRRGVDMPGCSRGKQRGRRGGSWPQSAHAPLDRSVNEAHMSTHIT